MTAGSEVSSCGPQTLRFCRAIGRGCAHLSAAFVVGTLTSSSSSGGDVKEFHLKLCDAEHWQFQRCDRLTADHACNGKAVSTHDLTVLLNSRWGRVARRGSTTKAQNNWQQQLQTDWCADWAVLAKSSAHSQCAQNRVMDDGRSTLSGQYISDLPSNAMKARQGTRRGLAHPRP